MNLFSIHNAVRLNSVIVRDRFVSVCFLVLAAGTIISAQENQDVIEREPAGHMHHIFVANPDGSNMSILAPVGDYRFQGSNEWSRDGKRIAFDVYRGKDGEEGVRFSKIAIANADGTDAKVLGDGVMPSLSPKGNRLAYSQPGRGVLLMDLNGEAPKSEVLDERGWGTAWSPDGKYIAYATFGPTNLVLYDVVEGSRRKLFKDGECPYRQINWNFAWSPDGEKIAFRAGRGDGSYVLGIAQTNAVNFGEVVRFTGLFEATVCWSPDGTKILFAAPCLERNGLWQIYTVDANSGGTPELLPNQPANRSILDMAFSPDGTKLTFSASPPIPATADK